MNQPVNLDSLISSFVLSFGLILYVSVNSFGHVETVSSPYHTFSCAVNPYFVHILSLVPDNKPS